MKILLLSSFFSLLSFCVFAQPQVFDYSKFPTAPTVINLGQSFSIVNFDACWNLKFSYKDNADVIRTKTWLGRNLAQKLFTSNEPLEIKISDDRKRLIAGKLTYDEEIPSVSSVTFEPVKDHDITGCAVENTKLEVVGKRIAATTHTTDIEEIQIPAERNPFYDAILLQNMLKTGKSDQIKAFLSLYGIDSSNIDKNEALKRYKPDFFLNAQVDSAFSVAISSEKMLANSQGGSDFVSILTDALAQFIAKRVKEELTLAYLNRFRNFLEEKNTQTHIGTLLPESYKVMTEVEPYDYTTFWQAMQEGFQDDVAQFPENTMDFVRVHEAKFTDKNLYAGTLTGLYTLRGAYRRYSAVAILDSLELLSEIQKFDPTTNIGSALRTLSLLSRSLHNKDGKGWVRPHELAALANERTRDFFVGLLIAREDTVTQQILFKDGTGAVSLKKVLLTEYKNPKFRQQLNGLLSQLELLFDRETQVEKDFDKIDENNKNKVRTTFERYETYAKQLLNLIDYSAGFVNSLPSTGAKAQAVSKKVTDYTAIAHTGIDLTKHMFEKRYNLAFFDVVKLLKDLKVNYFDNVNASGILSHKEKKTLKADSISDMKNINLASIPVADSAIKSKLINQSNLWEDLVRYGTFIANVAGADSAAQIVAALESAAAPVGSYRIKHDYNFTVTLNSYGGISGAREKIFRPRPTSTTPLSVNDIDPSFTLSPSAPVGIHLGWGNKGRFIESFGIFLPIIDVGAPFALRLQGKVSTLPEKLSWDNILSPGIYGVFGFRNAPITFSVGAQYGAGLRKLDYEEGSGNNLKTIPFSAQSWWFGGTIAVDVPILNLHVSKGKRK